MTHAPPHAGLEHLLARIIQDFMQFMHETGLSRPQIHALLHIFHAGECPISDIAALTGSSPAAASQLVERLVQQGLVQRTEDPQNRRAKKLRLTDKSLELIQEGVTSNHFLADLMEAMPAKRRQVVHAAFGYLAEASRQVHSSPKRKVDHHA
jgi:DNA-binding MarR family transcriptional regulator